MRIRNEIGSEFWDIPTDGKNTLFPDDTKWFISGRSALAAILAENSFKTAAVPVWCCESMLRPFADAGIALLFYSDTPPCADVTLLMDYFGYAGKEEAGKCCGVVIRDITHSLFAKQFNDADYYFGSLRKWAGFWTGGFAWGFRRQIKYNTDTTTYVENRKKAMELKSAYITGEIADKKYLTLFSEAEAQLENCGILPGNERDIELAKYLDVTKIRAKRRKNAEVLLQGLGGYAVFPRINADDCPMFVPIMIERRDELRNYLIQHSIYCPVHWPVSKYHRFIPEIGTVYEKELSLVCDQRYSEKDMDRMLAVILDYLNKRD